MEPGETKTVTLELKARDLSFYYEKLIDWYAPTGKYEVMVGHSSADIRLTVTLQFTTAKLLPMQVGGTTTLGELMADSRTSAVLTQIMKQVAGGENSMESDDAMV